MLLFREGRNVSEARADGSWFEFAPYGVTN